MKDFTLNNYLFNFLCNSKLCMQENRGEEKWGRKEGIRSLSKHLLLCLIKQKL